MGSTTSALSVARAKTGEAAVDPIRHFNLESASRDVVNQLKESQWINHFLQANAETLVTIADRIVESFNNGGKLFTFGNGGSASDAQHIAAELAGRFFL